MTLMSLQRAIAAGTLIHICYNGRRASLVYADAGSDENFIVFDEARAEDQKYIAEEYEVAEIEEKMRRRRQMAIDYGSAHKNIDWDEITKQYVTYIPPEESEHGYIMVIDEDQEVQYETVY